MQSQCFQVESPSKYQTQKPLAYQSPITGKSRILQQMNQSPFQSPDVISQYQEMVDKFQQENKEMKQKLDDKENENEQLKQQINEMLGKEKLWQRIEQQLKEKIRSLQEDFYKSTSREKQLLSESESQQWKDKLEEMQEALVNLESRFDKKETELLIHKKSVQHLEMELQHAQQDKQQLIEELGHNQRDLEDYQASLSSLSHQVSVVSKDRDFFREKYSDMQGVIEGCSKQMQEFDQVNSMSYELIEKLQDEVSSLKAELDSSKLEIDHLNRAMLLQQLQQQNEETIRLKDFISIQDYSKQEVVNDNSLQEIGGRLSNSTNGEVNQCFNHLKQREVQIFDSEYAQEPRQSGRYQADRLANIHRKSPSVGTDSALSPSASDRNLESYQTKNESKTNYNYFHNRSNSIGQTTLHKKSQPRLKCIQRNIVSTMKGRPSEINVQLPSMSSFESNNHDNRTSLQISKPVLGEISNCISGNSREVLSSLEANIAKLESEHEKDAAKGLSYSDGQRKSHGLKVRERNEYKKQLKAVQLELTREKRMRDDDYKWCNFDDDQENAVEDPNISPRSQEQMLNINSGICQLVDDVVVPQKSKEDIEQMMNSLQVNGKRASEDDQEIGDSIFDKEFVNLHTQISAVSNEYAGGTPLPGFNINAEAFQKQPSDITEIHNPLYLAKGQSRYSSDGEGPHQQNSSNQPIFQGRNNSQEGNGSDYAMGGYSNSQAVDERYSIRSYFEHNSDYQDQLDRYGYIFQSPDINNNNLQQQQFQLKHKVNPQPSFGGIGVAAYHHPQRHAQGGTQVRANSFDKLAGEGTPHSHIIPNHKHQLVQNHDELETHSAQSTGNHSAFSDGDLYNNHQFGFQQYQAYPQHPNYQYSNGIYSNQAAYGAFTPQVQFTGSSQKYSQGTQGFDGTPVYYNSEEMLNEDGLNQQHIEITGSDVNLQKNIIGSSPSRPGEQKQFFKPQNFGGFLGQQEQFEGQFSHFKTPSPYRNSDVGPKYSNQTAPPHNNINPQRNLRMGVAQSTLKSDPFYPTTVQNQKPNSQFNKGIYQPQRSSMIDQYTGYKYDHSVGLGMNAPPMTRGIDFSHNESNMMMMSGPLLAFQNKMPQNHMYAHQSSMGAQPFVPAHNTMRQHGAYKQTNSQERDPSYQAPNFQTLIGPMSKSGVNTPTYNDAMSASSHNSNSSQNFQHLAVDGQAESLFHSLIKQFDECPNVPQKLDIIRGTVHKMALTQTGSRFLQKQLARANASIVAFFLEEIGPHLSELMVDNYGNYFCQKLLSSCSGDQRLAILRGIQERFIEICCNRKGTHTIQTMFDLVNLPEEEDFIRDALIGNIIRLAKDPQGTHVVQKVMQSFAESKREFIFEEVFDHFIELAKNTNGLCVIKKLVSCTGSQDQAKRLLSKMSENVIDLVQDPYGNYAVTEVINNWDAELCKPIFMILKTRISQLSNQKFSSNVIERCLEKADGKTRALFIEELALSDKLTSLIKNSYGNYVVQKALKISIGKNKTQLIQAIQKCIPEISDKKIRSKWENIIEEASVGEDKQSLLDLDGDSNGGHRQVILNKRTNSSDNSK